MKKLIAFGLVAIATLAACNTQSTTELLEDDSTDLTFFAAKAPGAASSALRTQSNLQLLADGDVPALKVRLRIKNQKNAAGILEKIASGTFKWDDTATTMTGAVTLETRRLNSATVLGSTTANVSSNKTGDAVANYTGNIANAASQVVGTDALCVDVTWNLSTGGATPAYSFAQTQKVTFCQKQPPPAVADLTVTSAGSVSAAINSAKQATFVVRNNGPKAATNVSVVVTVPNGLEYVPPSSNATQPFFTCIPNATPTTFITCNAATLSKSSKDIKLSFKGSSIGGIAIPATVSSATIDPINSNNSGSVNFSVTNTPVASISADLAVGITQPSSPAPKVGVGYTYSIAITNTGPDASTAGRTLNLYRSSSLTFGSATLSGVTCSNTGDITTCTLPSIANAATLTLPLVVTPSVTGIVGVTAELSSMTEDSSSGNDNTSVSSDVQP